jgi:hypothetical protein
MSESLTYKLLLNLAAFSNGLINGSTLFCRFTGNSFLNLLPEPFFFLESSSGSSSDISPSTVTVVSVGSFTIGLFQTEVVSFVLAVKNNGY